MVGRMGRWNVCFACLGIILAQEVGVQAEGRIFRIKFDDDESGHIPVVNLALQAKKTSPNGCLEQEVCDQAVETRLSGGDMIRSSRAQGIDAVPYLPRVPLLDELKPTADDLARANVIEERMHSEFSKPMLAAIVQWAAYNKGLRTLLVQFSRSEPTVEKSFERLAKTAQWRSKHRISDICVKSYPVQDRSELKRRILNGFFFGHTKTSGAPIYYSNMALVDLDHKDLVPGKFGMDDLSVIWIQEMEYRERVLFPQRSKNDGFLVNSYVFVMNVEGAGLSRLGLTKLLKYTALLNSVHYPESLAQLYVMNCPSTIAWLYSFVKPILPKVTQKKIVFVRGNGHEELLGLTRDEGMIPRDYGGLGPPQADLLESFNHEIEGWLRQQAVYNEFGQGLSEETRAKLSAFEGLADG